MRRVRRALSQSEVYNNVATESRNDNMVMNAFANNGREQQRSSQDSTRDFSFFVTNGFNIHASSETENTRHNIRPDDSFPRQASHR
jgi:hypothetical protein